MCNILCLYIVSAVVGYSIAGITIVYVTPTSFVFGQVFSLFLLLCVDNGFYLFLPPSPLSFPSLSLLLTLSPSLLPLSLLLTLSLLLPFPLSPLLSV